MIEVWQTDIEMIRLLQREKAALAAQLGTAWANEDWIFTTETGSIMHPQTPSKQFKKCLIANGLPVRKFHCLRHTSATLLLYSGANIMQVKSRLGHGNIATTQRYLHAVKDADTEEANALQSMLFQQFKRPNTAAAEGLPKAK